MVPVGARTRDLHKDEVRELLCFVRVAEEVIQSK